MRRQYFVLLGLSAALLLGVTSRAALAEDVTAECTKCHGADGISKKPESPTIAGMPAELQQAALEAFRDGSRKCAKVPQMCKTASKLTDEQIKALAEKYSAMPYKAVVQPSDAALAATGKALHTKLCKNCHGATPGDGDSGNLHGQPAEYLRQSLGELMSGARDQDKNMKAKTAKLTPADIDALVNYYASYK